MIRRLVVASVLCSAAYLSAANVSAQRTNQSDATGAAVGLFSRGMVRAFGAPPAPPPTIIITPAMLDALCIERSDAILVYATLSRTAETGAERMVLTLLRGGIAADDATRSLRTSFVLAGAGSAETDPLLRAANGLLAPVQSDVPNVAAAVARFNELIAAAPPSFLARPPAEFTALRLALGRLSAAANHAFASERVYPGLDPLAMRYANDADWLKAGQPIQVAGETYFQFGKASAIGDRSFRHIADYNGVWVLAPEPVAAGSPPSVYVPLRTYCDVELVPYMKQERVIKRLSLRIWQ